MAPKHVIYPRLLKDMETLKAVKPDKTACVT